MRTSITIATLSALLMGCAAGNDLDTGHFTLAPTTPTDAPPCGTGGTGGTGGTDATDPQPDPPRCGDGKVDPIDHCDDVNSEFHCFDDCPPAAPNVEPPVPDVASDPCDVTDDPNSPVMSFCMQWPDTVAAYICGDHIGVCHYGITVTSYESGASPQPVWCCPVVQPTK